MLEKSIKQLNRVSTSVSLGLGLGLVLGLVLSLMPSSDTVLKSTVLSSSCVLQKLTKYIIQKMLLTGIASTKNTTRIQKQIDNCSQSILKLELELCV